MNFKFRDGKYLKPITTWVEKGRIWIKSGYIETFLAEVRCMAGRKWHGNDKEDPKRLWSVTDCPRNWFQLNYLAYLGDKTPPNPYARYDAPISTIIFPARNRLGKAIEAYNHQKETANFILTRRMCIIAEEMGIGKTLAAIMALESIAGLQDDEVWYVAPKAVLKAIERELIIWSSRIRPKLMTYEGLVKIMENWPTGQKAPRVVIFDESSRTKTPTAKRSVAAKALADGVRADWGDQGYVVLMTGTPAPKSPEDWWWQCEIACPGYLKEGDIFSFRNRIAVLEKQTSIAGGVYNKRITWRDDVLRCKICGQLSDHPNHLDVCFSTSVSDAQNHPFVKGVNEVHLLYKRMQGLVLFKFKKDCLDLPEKRYVIADLTPTPSMLRAANLIVKSSPTVIQALTRCRELSDGFQYVEVKQGKEKCPRCNGTRKAIEYREQPGTCPSCSGLGFDDPINQCPCHTPEIKAVQVECPNCDKDGEVEKYVRSEHVVATPKDDELEDDLESQLEVGRIVIFGGFTATVDRIVRVCHKNKWATIKLTGKGWKGENSDGMAMDDSDFLSVFQDWKDKYPLVAFCADAESGGLGLTLTAAALFIFYSNSFKGEARTQAEDRGHRPGMDFNRGVTIKDYLLLPQDTLVRDNLIMKRQLELLSMGDLAITQSKGGRVD